MRLRFPAILLAIAVVFPSVAPAGILFRPKKNIEYVAPGDEEINGTARELYEAGQSAENSGDRSRALKAYRTILKKYPKDTLAGPAAYRFAVVLEQDGDYLKAAEAYRVYVEKFPRGVDFEPAIEAQFRIGEMYLAGKKVKFLGIPLRTSMERATEIFAGIVRSAPYGKYTARAQFNIGRATEKSGNADAAVKAYQSVIEKFPEDPIAADAQYQIGYIWYKEGRSGARDAKASDNAKVGFQDFLYRYPKSEKAAQAKENLRTLEHKQTTDAFGIAKFYDKQKNYRAAVIYYNDVIRQQPTSAEGEQAKRRVEELRAKVGDAALQSAALTAATAKKPAPKMAPPGGGENFDDVPMRMSPADVAPLPPPEYDESLPPPASLNPGNTTAPYIPATDPASTPEPSPDSTPGSE